MTLDVVGPTNAQIIVGQPFGTIAVDENFTRHGTSVTSPWLHFGTPGSTTHGIGFTQTNTPPPNFAGSVEWIQLMNSDSIQTFFSDGSPQLLRDPGLDGPYPSGASDSPGNSFPADSTGCVRNFSATIYLLWQPNAADAQINGVCLSR